MVIDTLDNLEKYASLNPLFPQAFEYLRSIDFNTVEEGKIQLKGSDLFVNITTAKGKTKDTTTLETHKNMIDIQIPVSATETMGYTPLCDLPEFEYNAEKDITKYTGVTAQSYIDVKPGMFAIFFPQDGHAPCISESAEIKKIIVKILA